MGISSSGSCSSQCSWSTGSSSYCQCRRIFPCSTELDSHPWRVCFPSLHRRGKLLQTIDTKGQFRSTLLEIEGLLFPGFGQTQAHKFCVGSWHHLMGRTSLPWSSLIENFWAHSWCHLMGRTINLHACISPKAGNSKPSISSNIELGKLLELCFGHIFLGQKRKITLTSTWYGGDLPSVTETYLPKEWTPIN